MLASTFDPVPYAGIQLQLEVARNTKPADAGNDTGLIVFTVFLDMPLSFVLDTALLPITVPIAAIDGRLSLDPERMPSLP